MDKNKEYIERVVWLGEREKEYMGRDANLHDDDINKKLAIFKVSRLKKRESLNVGIFHPYRTQALYNFNYNKTMIIQKERPPPLSLCPCA